MPFLSRHSGLDPESIALSAAADFIISGDKDLCEVDRYKSVRIIKAADFIRLLEAS